MSLKSKPLADLSEGFRVLITVALALRERVQALASADRDFERVKELVVYSPKDLTSA